MRDYFASLNYNYDNVQISVNEDVCDRASADGTWIRFGIVDSKRWARSSEVVYHELTHNVIYRLYGNSMIGHTDLNGNCDDQVPERCAMDEGFADYFAASKGCSNPGGCDPRIAKDVLTGAIARTLENDEIENGNAYHDAQVIGGAAWRVRQGIGGLPGLGSRADELVFRTLQSADRPRSFYEFLNTLYKVETALNDQENFFLIETAFRHHYIFSVSSGYARLNWNMVSVPVGSYYPSLIKIWPETDWVQKYNANTRSYETVPLSNDFIQGVGYWARFPS